METASFTGFVKVVIYIILFYYIAKFVMRLLLPYLLKKAVQKASENMQNQSNRPNYQQQVNNPPSPNSNPRSKKKIGEYVDFEEIE